MKFAALYRLGKQNDGFSIGLLLRHIYYKLRYNLNMVLDNSVSIVNPRNIQIPKGRLEVGFVGPEFVMRSDKTLLCCLGKVSVSGRVRINKGCRVYVAPKAQLFLSDCFVNSNVIIMCEHGVTIGANSAIGWGTQIIDDDYHSIQYANSCNAGFCADVRGGGGRNW